MSAARTVPLTISPSTPVEATTADPALAALGGVLLRAATESRTRNAWRVSALVVTAHLTALWALLQIEAVRSVVQSTAPTWVSFIAPPQTPPAPQPPTRAQAAPAQTQAQPRVVQPQLIAAQPNPQAPAPDTTATTSEPAPAVVAAAAPAPVAVPAPAPPLAPPAPPRIVPSSAVQYLVQPPIEVPLASRRLGEQGTVWLRVRVGLDGLPQQISVQKSSGFERLDRQALDAMRQARFTPQTENGQPIEWIVTAPLHYEID